MGSYKIKSSAEEVRVDFFGALSADNARALQAELASELGKSKAHVLFNLTGMIDASFEGRELLVAIQRAVREAGRRSCWVDDRARFRGLALWVMHTAEDPLCQVRSDIEQGRKWLADSVDRVTAAFQTFARVAK